MSCFFRLVLAVERVFGGGGGLFRFSWGSHRATPPTSDTLKALVIHNPKKVASETLTVQALRYSAPFDIS